MKTHREISNKYVMKWRASDSCEAVTLRDFFLKAINEAVSQTKEIEMKTNPIYKFEAARADFNDAIANGSKRVLNQTHRHIQSPK